MNEQIRRLLKDTGQKSDWNEAIRELALKHNIQTAWSYSREMIMPINYDDFEKFTVEIIRICADIAEPSNKFGGGTYGDAIRAHFQVSCEWQEKLYGR